MTSAISGRSVGLTPVQRAALAVGSVFLLIGVLGFVPGITADYDRLMFSGPGSGAMLFGVFKVSVLHNIVHLLFGAAGLLMSRTFNQGCLYLVIGGSAYLVLSLYGSLVPVDGAANFVPFNAADNWLHVGSGVAMVALGIKLGQIKTRSNRRRIHRAVR